MIVGLFHDRPDRSPPELHPGDITRPKSCGSRWVANGVCHAMPPPLWNGIAGIRGKGHMSTAREASGCTTLLDVRDLSIQASLAT